MDIQDLMDGFLKNKVERAFQTEEMGYPQRLGGVQAEGISAIRTEAIISIWSPHKCWSREGDERGEMARGEVTKA